MSDRITTIIHIKPMLAISNQAVRSSALLSLAFASHGSQTRNNSRSIPIIAISVAAKNGRSCHRFSPGWVPPKPDQYIVNSQLGNSRSHDLAVRCQDRIDHKARLVEIPKIFRTSKRGHIDSAEAFRIRLLNTPISPHVPLLAL